MKKLKFHIVGLTHNDVKGRGRIRQGGSGQNHLSCAR